MRKIQNTGRQKLVSPHWRQYQKFFRAKKSFHTAGKNMFAQTGKIASVEDDLSEENLNQTLYVAGGNALNFAGRKASRLVQNSKSISHSSKPSPHSSKSSPHSSKSSQRRKNFRVKKFKDRFSSKTRQNVLTKTPVLSKTSVLKTVSGVKALMVKMIAAIGALFTSASMPVLAALSAVIAIVAVVLSLFSFLFASNETSKPQSQDFIQIDDYPWAHLVRDVKGVPSAVYNTVNVSTSYYFGNCTDFVFWRINRDMGASVDKWVYTHSDLTPAGGNGSQWGSPSNMKGWLRVKNVEEIMPGDIISYQGGVYGSDLKYGHVAYVASNVGQKIVTENYSRAQYYIAEHDYLSFRRELAKGGVVVLHNPALTVEKRALLAAKNSSQIIVEAQKHLGKPYVWGGSGPAAFDCSGFTSYVYGKNRISLPRTADEQYQLLKKAGKLVVDKNQLAPGDLIFFAPKGSKRITHVGIALGGGQMIHAASPGRGVVKEAIYEDMVSGGRP